MSLEFKVIKADATGEFVQTLHEMGGQGWSVAGVVNAWVYFDHPQIIMQRDVDAT